MSRFCGSCGTQAEPGDRFCPGCGKTIEVAPPAAEAPRQPAFAPPAPFAAAPPFAAPPPFGQPPKPETQWHYAVGGNSQGPLPESELRMKLLSLPPDTMVWNAGLPGWKTAAEVGLKPPPAPLPPAPKPIVAAPPPPFIPLPPARRPLSPPSTPPASNFAPQPGYVAPAFVAAAAPMQGGPMPPNMHWAVLLILSWITAGLAGLIWAFKQAAFVKKIDPSSKAMMLLVLTLFGVIAQIVLALAAMGLRSSSAVTVVAGLVMILNLVIIVAGLVTIFSMRSSIQRYYNTVEPMGLRLSGVMTFFFTILYFQYHFSRIAEWKKTGRLG